MWVYVYISGLFLKSVVSVFACLFVYVLCGTLFCKCVCVCECERESACVCMCKVSGCHSDASATGFFMCAPECVYCFVLCEYVCVCVNLMCVCICVYVYVCVYVCRGSL